MGSKWEYGEAYKRHPIENGIAVFENESRLKTHNIFSPLPEFMKAADLVFVDPPWSKGNMTSFYTKADMPPPAENYIDFYGRLFCCIAEIKPNVCYTEIGKEHLADFIIQMRHLYRYVTFYNSTYYHNKNNLCYVVRGSNKASKPKLDGMDEEDIISWVCKNEDYRCIGDLCMGRGLVACGAYAAGRRFVGTELNHKRLSVALENLHKLGGRYHVDYA